MEMESRNYSKTSLPTGSKTLPDATAAVIISNVNTINKEDTIGAGSTNMDGTKDPLVENGDIVKEKAAISSEFPGGQDANQIPDNIIVNMRSDNTLNEDVNLSWANINVFVDVKKGSCLTSCGRQAAEGERLQILKNVSGRIQSGSFVALMGSSGSGKSTLMNVLSHRNTASVNVSGSVLINNKPVNYEINNISAYVQQEDLFIGTLTVREHLLFQALLRMEKHISENERIRRVEKTIAELGLTKCSDTVIGIPGRLRGISGGEKKRLSFASEILTDPSLLFVDEPTSGLDSFMAQTVVETLRKLAQQGKTVFATIHQPSSEVYRMFDNIILLSDGCVAYVGSRDDAIPYFDRIGYPCPTNYNPADHFIQILSFIPEHLEESAARIKFICEKHEELEEEKENNGKRIVQRVNSFAEKVIYGPRYQTGWFTQLRVLLYRSILSAKRDKMVSLIRIMQSFILGIVVGLIYLRLDYNQTNIQNFTGLLFFIVTNLSFQSLQGVIFVFPVEVPVFLREHKNGMYRADTYYLAKTLAEVPVFSIAAILLIAITYWMTGLREEVDAFFIAVGIGVLVINTAASYGYVISTLSSSVETATALGPVIMLPLLLFGGFFINNDTVPKYFIWLRYLSWFNYAFEDLMINQWDGYTKCLPGSNKTLVAAHSNCVNGKTILETAQFHPDNFYPNIYCMVGLLVGFRILAFLLLLRRASKTH